MYVSIRDFFQKHKKILPTPNLHGMSKVSVFIGLQGLRDKKCFPHISTDLIKSTFMP